MTTESILEPISKCFNPVHFYSSVLKKDFLLPCGKCAACRLQKDSKYSRLSNQEIKNNKYALFFTLTYDNTSLPCYFYADDSYDYSADYVRVYSNRDGSALDVYNRDVADFDLSTFNLPQGAMFPYVCVQDVQKFFKRLRINIQRALKDKSIKIRYLISAEYGPRTFRPHYHGIIYFNDPRLLTNFKINYGLSTSLLSSLIAKSWPFADYSRTAKYATVVNTGASNYVSSYASSSSNLPRFLQYPETKPWTPRHSTRFGFSQAQRAEIFQNVSRGTYGLRRTDLSTKTTRLVPFASSDRNRLFPRFALYTRTPYAVQQYLLSCCCGGSLHNFKSDFAANALSLHDTFLVRQLANTSALNVFNRTDRPPCLSYSFLDFCQDFSTYEQIVSSPMLTSHFKHVFKACRAYMDYTRRSSDDFLYRCDQITKHTQQSLLTNFYNLQNLYYQHGFKKSSWFYPLDFWQSDTSVVSLSVSAYPFAPDSASLGYFYSDIFANYKQNVNSLIINKMRVKAHNDVTKLHNLIKTY